MTRLLRYSLIAAAAVFFLSAPAWAATVTIQPIQICDDAGTSCANSSMELYEAETDKIWAQAGIDINFLSFLQINETDYLDTFVGSAAPVATEGLDVMDAGTALNDPDVTLAINMFFVDQLNSSTSLYGLGCGAPVFLANCVGRTGIFISDEVFLIGRLDTIAHEIGHVLGLTHTGFGAGGANNLMTSGGSRTTPTTINDIFPDGAMLSQLTQEQIDEIFNSRFVVTAIPEPGTLALLGFGLAAAAARRRRRKT